MALSRQYFSNAIANGLKILRLFDTDRTKLSLNEISQELGLNKASVFRFVNTLIELGYLIKEPRTKMLSLGNKSISLAFGITSSFNLSEVIKPFVDEIHDIYDVTVRVGIYDVDRIFFIYRKEAKEVLTFRLPTITTLWHWSAAAKAVLAYLPESEVESLLSRQVFIKRTKNTITNKEDLLADLEKTRKRGYSTNNEEWIIGLIGIGAPIFNLKAGQVIGVVVFAFSTSQYSLKETENKFAKVLLKLTKEISEVISS